MGQARSLSFAAALLATAMVAVSSCKSTHSLPESEGGIEIGLRRGSGWSTLKVRPPRIIGPRVNLKLGKGTFSGSIDGRPVNITMEPGGFRGMGPAGMVAVDVQEGADQLIVEGTWNGARVHFEITSETFKGSLAIYQGRTFDRVFYCQYMLDRVEKEIARVGISICNSLPEDTLLEIPREVVGWLTKNELVVVLLALLSSPPFTVME